MRVRFGDIRGIFAVDMNTDGNSARRDFLTYALSLMRAHNSEHVDNLPIMDLTALRHVAYVLDALVYYMRSGTDSEQDNIRGGGSEVASVTSWPEGDDQDNDNCSDYETSNHQNQYDVDSMDGRHDDDVANKTGRRHPFFHRSDSTTFVGCLSPDPFQTPLAQALPLADRPQLLRPNTRREELFGIPRQTLPSPGQGVTGNVTEMQTPFDRLPTHLALSMRTADTPYAYAMPNSGLPIVSQLGSQLVSQTAVEVEPPCLRNNTTTTDTADTSDAQQVRTIWRVDGVLS